MGVPQITPEQRAEALEKAKQARAERRRLKDEVAQGRLKPSDVLAMDDEVAKRMRVTELVLSTPGVGQAKAAAVMAELGISETRRVGGLGRRQRAAIAERLG